jgi:asparagine synthase (glutamine-hydrolysing)
MNSLMARIRGHISSGRSFSVHNFMSFRVSSVAPNVKIHQIKIGSANLASTDQSCIFSKSLGQKRIGIAWDGIFWNKQTEYPGVLISDQYANKGFPECLKNLQGDFALSLYDEFSSTLFLARDRLGVRPLYYVATSNWIAFSSQPLALTELPGVGREPDPIFLGLYAGCHYRTFDNDPHASPYKNIRQVPAGHWVRWCGGTLEVERYWGLSDEANLQGSEESLSKEYRKKILSAVQAGLKEAKKPGFLLSGGMDSSSVLSSAVSITGRKQKAYSATYSDAAYDETGEIRTILDSKVSHWTNVRVGEQSVFETIRQMVRIHEEPVATATWLSHFEVCRRASQNGIGTFFTGLGGDELNAGEYEHFIFFFADLHRLGKKSLLRKEIASWQRHHDHPIYRKHRTIAMDLIRRRTDSARQGSVRPDERLYLRYKRSVNRDVFDLTLFTPVLDRIFSDSLKNRSYQDIFRETAPCCLRAQDRNGWAFGLPHYNPFYDVELVEFMFRIPGTLKIRNGITKHLLRKAMKGILPESTRTRVRKTGWNAPAHLWFSGNNGNVLKEMVRSKAVRGSGIYRVSEVDRIIDEHNDIVSTGKQMENHMMFLWQLANLCIWLEELA